MRWPPFPLSKYFFSGNTGLLLLILVPILNAPPTGIAHINGEKETVDPWSPAAIDQLKPYRLAEKRVHEKPGISWKWKRDRDDVNAQMEQQQELGADWRLAEPEQAKLLEQIPTIGPHDEFNFLANQSLLHLRTPTYSLQHKQCLEVHFRVEGKRTRLLLYTCRMYEGGLCVLDKFMATTNKKKLDQAEKSQLDMCHKLQPWMYLPSPFAFHFRFVRRPRKFADRESELRHFRRRYGRSATREVGRVQLTGFRSCDQACKEEKAEDGTGEQLDVQQTNVQDQHIEDPLEGWG